MVAIIEEPIPGLPPFPSVIDKGEDEWLTAGSAIGPAVSIDHQITVTRMNIE